MQRYLEAWIISFSFVFLIMAVLADTGALDRIMGELIMWARHLPPESPCASVVIGR